MELFDKKSIAEIRSLINSDLKIVITSHFNPDGDALGSSMALYHYFKDAGKDVKVILPNNIPDTFKWLPGWEEILIFGDENKRVISEAQLIFCLDYNSSSRVEKMQKPLEESSAIKIMIDHHPSPQEDLCKYIFSSHSSSATCELLWLFCKALDLKLSLDSVRCLYTGLVTDTGCFEFNSVTKQTFEVAAELASFPIDRADIIHHIYDSYSEGRMKLMGYVLEQKMVVFPEYHAAYISLSMDEARKYDYHVGDTEGFVNLPLQIANVNLSAFFMERDGIIRCSFRSKGDYKVNDLAGRYFNGGGHDNAAGGKSYKSLDETVRRFVSLLPKVSDN